MNTDNEKHIPESITLSVYNSKNNEYGISWHTEEAGCPILEYTKENDIEFANAIRVKADISDGIDTVQNRAVIKGLDNGEYCRWRVGDENGNFTEPYVFKALSQNPNETTLLVSSDTQTGNPEKPLWKCAWEDAINRNPDTELHLHLGDIVDLGGKRQLWKDTLEVNKEIIRTIPLLPSSGNHDHYYEYLLGQNSVISKMFNIQTPPQDKYHGIYYSVDCGPAHITVLCSGDMEKTNNHGLLESQLSWAKNDILSSNKKWRIVMNSYASLILPESMAQENFYHKIHAT